MNRVEQTPDHVAIRNVVISVSDKRSLGPLVAGLMSHTAARIISTGGTFGAIESMLNPSDQSRLIQVSDYTGQPEMQGGLVKTLDFKLYLGILSEPFNASHAADRERTGAELIDMVVVNLYPFESVVKKPGADLEDARGNIDIGGPSLLRAAAKSFLRVASVCDPDDYHSVVSEISDSGGLCLSTRFKLARKAFHHTASYDAAIAEHLAGTGIESLQKSFDVVGRFD